MSTLAVNTITNAAGGNTATINGFTPTLSNMAGRNRIINGEMRIDQRNNGAAVTTYFGYPVDRFQVARGEGTENATFSAQRSTDVPSAAGFTNSLQFTVTTAETSIAADERVDIRQRIEGFNVADLGFGASGASSVTLSFWVRSSLTGTFGGSLQNSAANRSYPYTYTISAANTWEYKTITIPGDTSGTWVKDNGNGLTVFWSLGAGTNRVGTAGAWNANNNTGATGQVQLISTNGATFYITGVQLEAGSVATPFERRPYGTELQLCMRYYERIVSTNGNGPSFPCFMNTTTLPDAMVSWKVLKRAAPTVTGASGAGLFSGEIGSTSFNTNGFVGVYQPSEYGCRARFQFSSGSATAATAGHLTLQSTSAWLAASSEL